MKHLAPWLFLLFLLTIVSSTVSASDVRINESFNNTPLKEVLTILKEKYDLKIAYGDQLISDLRINISINNLSVYETFQALLSKSSLTFEMLHEDVIIIYKSVNKKRSTQQEFSTIGVVQDAVTGERLPYAYIWHEQSRTNQVTNVDGYFTVKGSSLPLTLTINYLGYQDTTVIIREESIKKRLYVNLYPSPQKLDEVVITGNMNEDFIESEQIGKLDINPKIAYSVPSAGETDLLRTLQLLPGINATNENSSGLSIQGGTVNQNLFLFDGFTVYHVDHFFGYFSAFNPFAVKSIDLHKGAYDASLGGRVSGIVDISGKEGNLNKVSGSLSANLLSVNTSLEIPLIPERTSIFFSARRSYTDILGTSLFERIFSNFQSSLTQNQQPTNINPGTGMHGHWGQGQQPQINVSDHSLTPDFYYSDLNFRISSKIGLKNHFSFSFYDSNDLLNFTETTLTDIDDTLNVSQKSIGLIDWGNIGTSIKWSRLWNSRHYSNLLLSYSQYRSSYDDITTTSTLGSGQIPAGTSIISEQRNEINDVTIKIDHEWYVTNNQSVRAGVHTTVFSTDYRNVTDTLRIVDETLSDKVQLSIYGLYLFNLADRLDFKIGLRNNYYDVTNKWYPEPRISGSLSIAPSLKVKGGYGIHHQFINQSNTKNALQGSRDFWLLADGGKIPVQRAQHLIAGVELNKRSFLITGEYFRKNFKGLLAYAFSNGGLITEFPDYSELFYEGEGYSEGFEFLVKRSSPTFNAWAGYTLSTVINRFDDLNKGRAYFADHDQIHEVNLYSSLRLKNWELFTTWLYGSGKPYSTTNEYMTSDNPHIMLINEGDKNNGRLPEYHRLDAGLTFNTTLNNVMISSTLSIINLYNRQNTLDYRFTQLQLGHQGGHENMDAIVQSNPITSMGRTLNLSCTIKFQ